MTPTSGPDDLTVAWADVAARLPEGWQLVGLRCASTGLDASQRSEEWVAVADGPEGAEERFAADVPIAALQGLAGLLERADDTR